MKKAVLLSLVLTFSFLLLSAQQTCWQWGQSAGSTGNDAGQAIAVDPAGNSYVTGYFYNSVTFGSTNLTSAGMNDIFVAKMDGAGNWLWAKKAGSTSFDTGYDIAVDTSGNVYITGTYRSPATFGGTTLYGNNPYINLFVAKLDTNGNWLWAKHGGGSLDDFSYSIKLDTLSNAYVTGFFQGTAYFGSYSAVSAGGRDAFIAKIDSGGTWQWVKSAGGSNTDSGSSIDLDAAGNIYLTGSFESTAYFGTISLTSTGVMDIFAAKLDPAGNWIWAARGGSSGPDDSKGIAVAASSGIYVTGDFSGSADFGTASLTSYGDADIFAAKLDEDGNWLWAVQAGSSQYDSANCIALDTQRNPYITGGFNGTSCFGGFSLVSSGAQDIFLASLDPDGNWTWAENADGSEFDIGYGIYLDNTDSVYATGFFSSVISLGSIILSSNGGYDILTTSLRVNDQVLPLAPQNVSASRLENDILLEWDPVTEDTEGQPVNPDFYRVYLRTSEPDGDFELLGQSSATNYTHEGAGSSARGFYLVKAVIEAE